MTKIIIDSNIIFSAILNVNSRISQIIINGSGYYNFFAPQYVRFEIFQHQDKLKKIAHLSNDEFVNVYELIIRNINILSHTLIPKPILKEALEICDSIDVDDTVFIAVTQFVGGKLWTGDKKLIKGLIRKNFKPFVTTDELYFDFIRETRKK